MADEINVLSRTQIIFVEPTSGSVSIINAGPVGNTGPEGPPGTGGGGPSEFPVTQVDSDYTYIAEVVPAAAPSSLLRIQTYDTVDFNLVAGNTSSVDIDTQKAQVQIFAATIDGEATIIGYADDNQSYIEFDTDGHHSRLFIEPSNPNTLGGGIVAPKGSLCVDYVAAKLYINTNGVHAWSEIGGSTITLPLSPTDVGPGEPTDYAVYTATGWSAPPSSLHVWTGSGWVLLSGAGFGLTPMLSDTITLASFAATDSVTVDAPAPHVTASVSDTFTPGDFSATDSATVTLV